MDKKTEKIINQELNRDSIQEIEEFLGHSYQENSDAENYLMLQHHIQVCEEKKALQLVTGDTTFSMVADDYIANVSEFGFREVYSEEFSDEKDDIRHFKIFWHDWGILLYFDTYIGKINGGDLAFNWNPSDELSHSDIVGLRLSGTVHLEGDKNIWVGKFDCRESVRFRLNQMHDKGEFVKPWIKRPFLWLLNGMEERGKYDRKAINSEKISKLPDDIQSMIKGE